MRIYGLLPLVLPELELRCGAGSPNHDCTWQGLLRYLVPIAVPTVPTVIETCGLLAPFDDMDALRDFSNHVYFKYMGNCRRKEPPRNWVKLKSLVNHENLKIKPEQSYYLFGLASFATFARLWAQKVPRPMTKSVYSECLKATSLLPLKSRK